MAMSNKVVLNNGDVFRVIQNNGKQGAWCREYLIQAKEQGKTRYYVIGGKDTLTEAIADMNDRAKQVNEKGFIS
jgi:hypothetical protein